MTDANSRSNSQPKTRRLGRGLASLMANTRELGDANLAEAPASADAAEKIAGSSSGDAAVSAVHVTQGASSQAAAPSAPKGVYESASPASPAAAGAPQAIDLPDPAPAGDPASGEAPTSSAAATPAAPATPATPAAPAPAATAQETPAAPAEIDITAIKPNPYQPRRNFDETELAELAESIRVQGVLQPLLLARANGGYVLVAGERRLRAAALAGLQSVPCVIREAPREKMAEWAITENIQRSDLNPVEKAQAYRQYMDTFMVTQQQLASKLGQPRSTVANHLRILDLCDDAQRSLAEGLLSFGHAKVLAALVGREADQQRLLRKVIDKSLSVRQLEELIAELGEGQADLAQNAAGSAAKNIKSDYVVDVERQLTRAVGAKVTIKPSRRNGRGRIVLSYNSLDEFDRIAEALGVRLES